MKISINVLVAVLLASAAGCADHVYVTCVAVEADAGNGNAKDAGVSGPGSGTDGGGPRGNEQDGGSGGSGGSADGGTGNNTPIAAGPWVNVTNNLMTVAEGGGDVMVTAHPTTDRVIAGVGKGKGLFGSDDGGKTWSALGTGANSDKINNGPTAIVFDPDHAETWWEVGIYGFGVFKTTDDGITFKHLGDTNHSDLLGVDFTDPARKTLLLGPHETQHVLYLSRDGGDTWTNIGSKLPPDSRYSTLPIVIDTRTFLVGSCGNSSGMCGVFRSTDGGDSWTRVTSAGPGSNPLRTKVGDIYWPLYGGGTVVSTDDGQNWTKTADGPVQLYSGSPVELPDGRVVTLGQKTLLLTSDAGKTWRPLGPTMPFDGGNCGIYGLTYSHGQKAFFISHNDCSGSIVDNSIYKSEFD
ncbi:MAG: hypothetical protein RLZZ450_329, partial [Pseudomonadota bacterium]